MTMFMKDIAQNFFNNCYDLHELRHHVRVTSYEEPGKMTVKAYRNGAFEVVYSMTEEEYSALSNQWLDSTNLRRNTESRMFWLINRMLDQGIKLKRNES